MLTPRAADSTGARRWDIGWFPDINNINTYPSDRSTPLKLNVESQGEDGSGISKPPYRVLNYAPSHLIVYTGNTVDSYGRGEGRFTIWEDLSNKVPLEIIFCKADGTELGKLEAAVGAEEYTFTLLSGGGSAPAASVNFDLGQFNSGQTMTVDPIFDPLADSAIGGSDVVAAVTWTCAAAKGWQEVFKFEIDADDVTDSAGVDIKYYTDKTAWLTEDGHGAIDLVTGVNTNDTGSANHHATGSNDELGKDFLRHMANQVMGGLARRAPRISILRMKQIY